MNVNETPIDIGYWRILQANRRKKERRQKPQSSLRHLDVPPGTYGMRDGEERVITNGLGNQYLLHATKSAVRSPRGRR